MRRFIDLVLIGANTWVFWQCSVHVIFGPKEEAQFYTLIGLGAWCVVGWLLFQRD